MQPEIIETNAYLFRIYDNNYLEYVIKENAVIDVREVLEGKRLLSKARPGEKFFVLGEGIDFFTLTKEARELAATREFSNNTYAVAFVTYNPSIWLLGRIYMKINKPHVPTRIFHNRTEAKKWLEEQMNSDQYRTAV